MSARAAQKLDLKGRRTSVPSAALIGLKRRPCPLVTGPRVPSRRLGSHAGRRPGLKKGTWVRNRCDRCTPPLPLASSRIRSTRRSASILLRARCRSPPIPPTTVPHPLACQPGNPERACCSYIFTHPAHQTTRAPTNIHPPNLHSSFFPRYLSISLNGERVGQQLSPLVSP